MLKKSLIIVVFLISFACSSNEKIKLGNEVVAKVEKFKAEKGRLPNDLTELEIKEDESGPIYYKKVSESKYIVWFGKELGESVIYNSETKQWE